MDDKFKEPFVELHRILDALKQRDLEPALEWAIANRDALTAQGSSLEFKLRRQAFLHLIKKGVKFQSEAITYAREHFSPFVSKHEKGMQIPKLITEGHTNVKVAGLNINMLICRNSSFDGLVALYSW